MAAQKGDVGIIAVDGSSNAEEATEWYLSHLHRPTTKLFLIHCIEYPSMPSRDTWEAQTRAGRQKAEDLAKKYQEKLEKHNVTNAEFIQEFENPGESIVSSAHKFEADFIVMGTRGQGKLRRTLMGSVSDYVVNHSPVPIIVCRHK
ncbi:DgyrCDS11415 [Dimorphilus gyrociliatus]|uniref:DgyrCDS11415 n=1 Tax=Dimorphilus gyrociliatus TaxID=2664684 RepID=A0A7I8W398_9ANNE|nr:DgyrCDS11415 [Dimorphilus gyrociliatus]